MKIKSDDKLHPDLAGEVQSLRSGMLGQTEKNPMPARFVTERDDEGFTVIVDKTTGRRASVPLFALSDVRRVLNDLFD